MPFNFRLNVQSVFRRLGIQTGARLPQLNEDIQMTMLVTDLSKLVPAPIEPRGMAGINLASAAGMFGALQIHSLAAGGIFVETIVFRAFGFAASEHYLIDVTLTDLGLPGIPNINIGSEAVRSRVTAGLVGVSTGGASIPAASDGSIILLQPGIFVPNQAFLSITTSTITERLIVAVFYRELPSVEEVG